MPWFRDNPVVEGDLDALLAGSQSEFRVSFRFEQTPAGVMVRGFPPEIGPQSTLVYLMETMARPDIELNDREDTDPEPRWLALSGRATDLAEATDILREGVRYDFKLHAPWRELVRNWFKTEGASEGLAYLSDLDL